jgi:hypothetical protein
MLRLGFGDGFVGEFPSALISPTTILFPYPFPSSLPVRRLDIISFLLIDVYHEALFAVYFHLR